MGTLPYKIIIGFGHQSQVGKDTAGLWLAKQHGFQLVSFADTLKDVCCIVFGWDRIDLEDNTFKSTEDPFWKITPRQALQRVGTDAMRNIIREDIWIKALERRIRSTYKSRYVITDVRFPNEADAVHSWGGHVIRIDRPGYAADSRQKHVSETALLNYDKWSGIITNNTTESELFRKVRDELNRLKIKLD